ncbi:MAG: TRAP transporter substrate-binding protein [Peptococcaceae bacterium]|jgi:TRAP-type C4-dicarboxylate transport system substrate-binding protein|nr:TRAP transporter substrate-binding protein [Peptococcaceae bacterium]
MKGKKMIALVVTAVLLALSGCSQQSSSPGTDKQAVVELRLAHFFPSTHPAETDLVKPWAQAIEKATGGKVRITSYPGESLLTSAQIYDGVVNGIADIGLSCFAYTRGRFPVLEVFELPGIVYNNSQAASKVAWEGIKKLNPKEVQDTKLLMVFSTGPGDLYTKVPVRTLGDLNGLEIRATGLSAKTLKALGAVPVAMPQSEAYESLSKSIVKGNLGPVEVLKGWRQAEVTKYLTKTPFLYNTLFFITMNKAKWDSLDDGTKKAIEEVSAKYFDEVACGLWDRQNADAMKFAAEKGMELIELAPDEAERWIKLVLPIQDEFVANMNKQGLEGQKILDTVKELAGKYK